MDEQEKNEIKNSIKRLEDKQDNSLKVMKEVSASLKELVELQKNHAVLAEKVRVNTIKIEKIESNSTWLHRIVGGALILAILTSIGLTR